MIEPTQVKMAGKHEQSLALATYVATVASLPFFATAQLCEHDQGEVETHYQKLNLVSDISAVAQLRDPNLGNRWGIAFGPTRPFRIGDAGSGKAMAYAVTNDASGAPHVNRNAHVIQIAGNGRVTGQHFNNTKSFNANLIVFVRNDGTISGWWPAVGNTAEVLVTRNGAIYTGVALATNKSGPVLLAANFSEGTIDEYDSSFRLMGRFADTDAPSGYAPFDVQNTSGKVFVTFAKQDAAQTGVAPGRGRGLIDEFLPANGTFRRFATGKDAGGTICDMNSPRGIALAPVTFGSHAHHFLVGNFGSGTVMAFSGNGEFFGLLKGPEESPVTIDRLWGLTFGTGGDAGATTDLYFAARPNGEDHGLFGVIQPPRHSIDDVEEADPPY